MNRNLIIGLGCLLDRRLLRIQKLVRENSSGQTSHPLEIGLIFEDDFYATFLCENGGAIGFFGDSISPLMMGDYGDFVVEEMEGDLAFSDVLGGLLTAVFLIDSEVQGALVGVKFVFGKRSLNILNIDDTIEAFSRIPQSIRNAGKFSLVPLR